MDKHEYYWELNIDKETMKTIGPKRAFDFFRDAIKQGREHILELYKEHIPTADKLILIRATVDPTVQQQIWDEVRKVTEEVGVKDSKLESALAKMFVNFIRFPKTDKNHLMTRYLFDLIGRFVINPEKDDSLVERMYEYASFKTSADYITLIYGVRSKPELSLPRIEAECMRDSFATGHKALSLKDLLKTAKTSYEHASLTASRILSEDFYKISAKEKEVWKRAARSNEVIANNYEKCLEILRTVNYKVFKN